MLLLKSKQFSDIFKIPSLLLPSNVVLSMGNSIPHRLTNEKEGSKIILPDGTVQEFENPVTVAELMLEHPQKVVVEFDPEKAHSKKPAPLPADKKLEVNKVYLMLPIKRGKPAALSSQEVRRLIMIAGTVAKSKTFASFTGFVPLFARVCIGAGGGDFREGKGEFGEQVMIKRNSDFDREEEIGKTDIFADVVEGRPEFLSRQVSGKGWKPSLDTITEKNVKTKVRHWLFKNKPMLL